TVMPMRRLFSLALVIFSKLSLTRSSVRPGLRENSMPLTMTLPKPMMVPDATLVSPPSPLVSLVSPGPQAVRAASMIAPDNAVSALIIFLFIVFILLAVVPKIRVEHLPALSRHLQSQFWFGILDYKQSSNGTITTKDTIIHIDSSVSRSGSCTITRMAI